MKYFKWTTNHNDETEYYKVHDNGSWVYCNYMMKKWCDGRPEEWFVFYNQNHDRIKETTKDEIFVEMI